jgi:hypothetical protein
LLNGLLAGLLGTAALSAFERVERALLGRAPIYAAPEVGRALMLRLRMPGSGACGRQVGLLLRWLYGPTLGALYAMASARHSHSVARSGLYLSSAVYFFEILALPATKATPAVREWALRELILLFCHTSAFAFTTAATCVRIAEAKHSTRD